jgi:GMP synthase-like glutamine amidotransferase
MSLAILETGAPPGDLAATYGDYPAMFRALLGLEARSYDVEAEDFPDDPGAHDAHLITGSPAGVYEDLHWIAGLIAFLQRAKGRAKLVGVCFGHQVMAQAFGGHVEKSAKGWGAGLMSYPIVARQPWMDDAPLVAVPASH